MRFLTLTNLIVLVHVLVSSGLVLFILLHAGRGGGLSDMFGGGMGGGLSGSSAMERNLDRLTIILGCVFGVTTVLLALRLK
jgi:preprotein translocase subunit SecG